MLSPLREWNLKMKQTDECSNDSKQEKKLVIIKWERGGGGSNIR